MSEKVKVNCPDCESWDAGDGVDRRGFLRLAGSAAALAAGGLAAPPLLASAAAQPGVPRLAKPAEALIQELYRGLSADQRRDAVYAWDHGAGPGRLATRLRMFNGSLGRPIGQVYTRPQQELVQRIIRAICADDDGFNRIATVVRTDSFGRNSWQGAGGHIFGDPTQGRFAFVFSAHHLTLRCDGNSEPGAAFGGPMFYGHSPDGNSARNIFNYQTRSVRSVFEALTTNQRRQAVVTGNPGEQYRSVRFRPASEDIPGLAAAELTSDQRRLVEMVMREVLSPFRHEDADEVMDIVRRNGGLDRIHLAFYRDRGATDNTRWHFWRLEGPGFVWNYRILPHVHCYVNIAAQPAG
jgi:hypothetical protein